MKNVVTIGGGTGTYNLLTGIKNIPNTKISCIVSMSDDGGSTGKIRDEYGVLPPGDIRRAIVALSDNEKTKILRKIFNHRFKGGSFDGHNLGNLIMMALEQMNNDFGKSIDSIEELFDIKGKVYPATFEKTRLVAQLENLEWIIGETNIDIPKHDPNLQIKKLHVVKEEYIPVLEKINTDKGISYHITQSVYEKFIEDKPKENNRISKIIQDADYIIFAPGDLYTSILPNILVGNITDYILSSNAEKIFFVNLFNKYGETTNFNLSNFLSVFEEYFGKDIFDKILMQDWENHPIKEEILDKYLQENKTLVKQDIQDSRIIKADFIKQKDMARHDSSKMKDTIQTLLNT